jgi:hypothetical protein
VGAVDDVKLVREVFRKLGKEREPVEIVQVWDSDYIARFCSLAKLEPQEFYAMAQLRASLANAEIFSTICQRYCAAVSTGIEVEIKRENPQGTFDDFQKAFPNRHAALTELARRVFDGLIRDVGAKQVKSYMSAMLLTRELAKAPTDDSEN